MATGLKIKDVADASGFTAATLRYYEQIGLLPETSRTSSGYRIYDQRTLDRLAFLLAPSSSAAVWMRSPA